MYETINEKVNVLAYFVQGYRNVKPFRFIWHDKEYRINKIGYVHKKQHGRTILHVFSVTDGSNFFELQFDPQELEWFLARTWDGEAN